MDEEKCQRAEQIKRQRLDRVGNWKMFLSEEVGNHNDGDVTRERCPSSTNDAENRD